MQRPYQEEWLKASQRIATRIDHLTKGGKPKARRKNNKVEGGAEAEKDDNERGIEIGHYLDADSIDGTVC